MTAVEIHVDLIATLKAETVCDRSATRYLGSRSFTASIDPGQSEPPEPVIPERTRSFLPTPIYPEATSIFIDFLAHGSFPAVDFPTLVNGCQQFAWRTV
jgi:hypothetical protein